MKEHIAENGRYRIITAGAVVIGSGAAGLNGAVRLKRLGVDDVVVITDRLGAGTSANTGSDKQTYYRLHPGGGGDSTLSMAGDLAAGGCMHGDTALIEATLSLQSFYHLVHQGVPFPHDVYGDYTGFRTDHDLRSRGTSAGPETSILMYRALLEEARCLDIPVLENLKAVELIVEPGKKDRLRGVLALPADGGDGPGPTVVRTDYLLLATGGPGDLYRDSVYPESQEGSFGLALAAGVRFQNLTESQFGLASVPFRWNMSGSFQQVLPRYVSTRPDGTGEEDFLAEFFHDAESMLRAQFLKGYEWPFDVRKVSGHGSSVIDLLVFFERKVRGRRVFLDYRCNPRFPGYEWNPGNLPTAAKTYLEKSSASGSSPVERLLSMNEQAYRLCLGKGIDLARQPLEIAVCHQHFNGGIVPSLWWETSLEGLYAAGECAGTHGIYRPGGSALNSGQVGSFRAAERVAFLYKKNRNRKAEGKISGPYIHDSVERILETAERKGPPLGGDMADRVRDRMSSSCVLFRDTEALAIRLEENTRDLELLERLSPGPDGLVLLYHTRDLLLTERAVVSANLDLLTRLSGGRGSFLTGCADSFFTVGETGACTGIASPEIDGSMNHLVQEAWMDGSGNPSFRYVPVRKIPGGEGWFEEVWRDYLDGGLFERL